MNLTLPRRMRKLLRPLPLLSTERLSLRPVTAEDTADMYAYSRDERTSRYLLWEPHNSPEQTRAHIRSLLRQYRALQFFDWALVEKSSGRMIGTAGFTRFLKKGGAAEIGYVLSPAFHRRGLAPEAVRAVLAFGFETLGINEAFCRIMEGNEPSIKVAARLGFSFLGYEKEPVIKRGVRQRVARFGLSREEYEKSR